MSILQQSYVKNPTVMYKFGYTTLSDANQRFSEETARIRGFKGIPLGRDYQVRTRWSIWVETEEEAKNWESKLESILPTKNLWTDESYNGITECRFLENEEAKDFIQELKDRFPKTEHSYKPGYYKVYFVMFIKK